MRSLLPHSDRRDHSFAGTARKRFSHHHAVWSRCAVFVIRKKQRDDAETNGEKISRKHEPMVGKTDGRLSRSRARRESMRRKQEPGRYREFVRNVSREYFSRRADVAVRDQEGASRQVGSRNRMGKCFSLRLKRASWRSGERNSRT